MPAGRQELRVRRHALHGERICSGRFLEFAFKTVEFKIKVTVNRMELVLPGDTVLMVRTSRSLSSHRPQYLTKIATRGRIRWRERAAASWRNLAGMRAPFIAREIIVVRTKLCRRGDLGSGGARG